MLRHKFNAVKCEYEGIKFASKKEKKRYIELQALINSGEVIMVLPQPKFPLKGGVKYIADFQIFWSNGSVTHEDVKGLRTALYVAKKKMVESMYPVKIIEI